MEEKFGIVIEAVTNGFKAKMNEIKNLGQQTVDRIKQGFQTNKVAIDVDTSKVTKIAELRREISTLKSEMKYIDPGTGVFREYATAIDQAERELKQLTTQQKEVKKNANTMKGMSLNFKNIGINVNKLGNSFQNAINKVKRFGLALLSVRGIYSLLSKASQAYMAFDMDLSNKIQSTWAGLGAQLAPIIEFIINLFAKAVAYVNAFISALTGINLIARANTKALNKQAGAAKSATKALSSIDEITNIQRDTGGGGGGGDTPQIDLPKVDTSKLEAFAKKLKDLFKQGKYFEMGKLIGEEITKALESIPWDRIKDKAGKIGKGLAEFINGGIVGTDWSVVGNTIAQGLNTAIEFAFNFLKTFNFLNAGKALATTINNFFKNVDWEKLGETVTKAIEGILDFTTAFLQEIDVKLITKKLGKMLDKIDWNSIAKKWYKTMMVLGPKLNEFLLRTLGIIITTIAKMAKETFKAALDIGINIIKGIINGITDAFTSLLKTINDKINEFIQKIRDKLGIHSPSTVMYNIGIDLIEGLRRGLSGLWSSIKYIFDDLYNKITGAFSNIKNRVSDIVSSLANSIRNAFSNIGSAIGNSISNAVRNAVNRVLSSAVRIINGFINTINSVIKVINALPGVKVGRLSKLSVPQLATGTNYVPEDQLAYIHKGEAVVPKKFNSAEYFSNINDNQETNALLLEVNKTLIEIREKDTTLNINGKELARTTYNDFRNEGNRLGQSSVVNVR